MLVHKTFLIRKLFIKYFFISLVFIALSLVLTSCKTKEGCGMDERVHVKLDKKGRKKSKNKSGLFPKKVNKRIRSGK